MARTRQEVKRVLEAARREREAGVYTHTSSSSCEVPQKQKGERLREKRKMLPSPLLLPSPLSPLLPSRLLPSPLLTSRMRPSLLLPSLLLPSLLRRISLLLPFPNINWWLSGGNPAGETKSKLKE